jgi:hypothetical protein
VGCIHFSGGGQIFEELSVIVPLNVSHRARKCERSLTLRKFAVREALFYHAEEAFDFKRQFQKLRRSFSVAALKSEF